MIKKLMWLLIAIVAVCCVVKAKNNGGVMVYTVGSNTPFDTIARELDQEKSIIQKSMRIHKIVDEVERGKRPDLAPYLVKLRNLKGQIVREFRAIAVEEADQRRRARQAQQAATGN